MSDPDVICYLFPAGENDALRSVFNMEQNVARCLSLTDGARKELSWWPLERAFRDEPCLKFTFSNQPKTRKGLVVGRCPDADLVLPDIDGVSRYHFAITFDDDNRLIIRDLNSTCGTQVIYKDEDAMPRVGIDWDALGPGLLQSTGPVIKVTWGLQFKLVVPNHDTGSQAYLDKVARFRLGTASSEGLFDDMRPSEAEKRRTYQGPTLWKKRLGGGAFGEVFYAFNVTTREEFALKRPRAGREYDARAWHKEAQIMKNISHVSEMQTIKRLSRNRRTTVLTPARNPSSSLSTHCSMTNRSCTLSTSQEDPWKTTWRTRPTSTTKASPSRSFRASSISTAWRFLPHTAISSRRMSWCSIGAATASASNSLTLGCQNSQSISRLTVVRLCMQRLRSTRGATARWPTYGPLGCSSSGSSAVAYLDTEIRCLPWLGPSR